MVLDPKSTSFTANGTEYRIESTLSVERWMDLQRIEPELAFGVTFQQMMAGLKEVYAALNSKDKLADAAVTTKNLMLGAVTVEEKRFPVVLQMACLFINYKDEDRTTFSSEVMERKVKDWKKEGIDMVSLFQLAFSRIVGYKNAYNETMESFFPKQPTNDKS